MAEPIIPFDYYERLRRRGQKEADPVESAVQGIFAQRSRKAIADSPPPDQVARTTKVARAAGSAPGLIEGREDEAERGLNAQRLNDAAARYPGVGRFVASNPRGAVMAQDDSESLGLLGRAWATLKEFDPVMAFARAVDRFDRADPGSMTSHAGTPAMMAVAALMGDPGARRRLPSTMKAAPRAVGSGFLSQGAGLAGYAGAVARDEGWDTLADYAAKGAANLERRARDIMPRSGDWVTDQVLGGFSNLPSTAVSLGTGLGARAAGMGVRAAALTGSAVGGMTAGGQSYNEATRQGVDHATAFLYANVDAASEIAGEYLGTKVFLRQTDLGANIVQRFLKSQIPEVAGEMGTTIAQSLSAWVVLPENRDKTFSDWASTLPEDLAATTVQTLVAGGLANVTISGLEKAVDSYGERARRNAGNRLGDVANRAARAWHDREFFQKIEKVAAQSRLNARDGETFRALMKDVADDSGVEHAYVPGEAVLAYMQSDAFDPDSDPLASYFDAAQEAAAAGGDMVLPADFAFASLPGTPAWAALKDDLRLSSDGMSAREADAWAGGLEGELDRIASDMAATDNAAGQGVSARAALVQSIADKAMNAGFTPDNARIYAELQAARLETRAETMGRALTGQEFDNTEIAAILPPALAQARKADATDLVVHALRKGGDAMARRGPSLLEWIAARGGIEDRGGDIASMGGDAWHKEKAFRKRLLKPFDDAQGNMLGSSGANPNSLDNLFDAAVSEGFFPDLYAQRENASTYGEALDANDFLDAIGSELRGNPVYAMEAKADPMRAAADELRQLLAERGLDPDGMTDAELRAAIDQLSEEGGVLDPNDARILYQDRPLNDGPRGRIVFPAGGYGTGLTRIELFESRNLSTLLHEMGHEWLEQLRADASDPDAPEWLRKDWRTVQDWFAAQGHAIGEDGAIPTEAHEMWARGTERYVMEGKAPTTALQRIFDRMRGWLLAIYRTVDSLRAPISPEVREVMGRMLATSEEITRAAEAQALSPLLKDPQAMGMTGPEADAYAALLAEARGEAQGKLLAKTMAVIRARETKAWRDAYKALAEEIAQSVDQRPLFMALAMMKQGRISRQWVVDEFGVDALDLLPRRVPPVYMEGGGHPGTLAELAGYGSARDMIEDLIGAEAAHRQAKEGGDLRSLRARAIETAAMEEMNRRYGDPLNDGSIEREALEAVHNEKQGEVIAAEIRVLARRSGKRTTPYRLARLWARGKVRQGVYAEQATPGAIQRHARAVAKAGREAEAAMLAGDVDGAFAAKQRQMLSSALLAEAKAAHDEVMAATRYMNGIARKAHMKSVDQDYLDQAHALLEGIDLRRRSQAGIERKRSFDAWAAEKRALGEEVHVPERFDYEGLPWSRMTPENLIGMADTVRSIMHLGRLKQTLLDNKERREFEEWRAEAIANLEETPGRSDLTTDSGKPKSWFRSALGAVLKVETLAREMDNGRPDGVWQRLLVGRATEAANYRDEQRDRVLDPIAALYKALPVAHRDRLAERVTVPEIPFRSADINDPRNGEPRTMTRFEVLGLALNMGNESNIDKLTRGYGIDRGAVESVLFRELREDDFTFVQAVWDALEKLRPDIAKAEKAMTGVEPEWIESAPLVTPYGTLRGGYYPVVYDPAQSQVGEDNLAKAADDLFGGSSGVSTAKGHTIKRTGYAAPILLSPEAVLFQHVEKIITRNAYGPWARDVLKVIRNPAIRAVMDRKMGPELRGMIEPWLRRQVREGITDERGAHWADSFLRKARANMSMVAMGFRWSTGVAQTVGLANSAGQIGVNNLRKGVARLLANPAEAAQFVMERSPEMAKRNEAMSREIGEVFGQMRRARTTGNPALRKVQERADDLRAMAFWHIGMIDRYIVAMPTWLGAHQKALGEGMTDEQASAYADSMVRRSQGSGRAKDLAAIQAGPEGLRLFTMFYTPFSVLLNEQYAMARDVRRGDYRRAAMQAFWFMVATPLLDALVSGDVPDDEDEEGWERWFARNIGFYLFAGVPLARDIANVAERKMAGKFAQISITPAHRALESAYKLAGDAYDATLGDGEPRETWLRHAIETPGYFLGLPTGQVGQTAQFLWDVSRDKAQPESIADWYAGLTKGKVEKD